MNWRTAVGIQSALAFLSLAILSLRVWVRINLRKQRLLLSDYLILSAWLPALAVVVCNAVTLQKISVASEDTLINGYQLQVSESQLKNDFAANLVFEVGLYIPKASLLAFYNNLIPKCFPGIRLSLYIIIGYSCAGVIITACLNVFWCMPVSDNWSTIANSCSVWNSWETFGVNWALNITSDLAVFILPFFLLRYQRFQTRQRWSLVATFALGLLTIASSIARFTWFTSNIDVAPGDVWCVAEIHISIIVVCLPALKPLLKLKCASGETLEIRGTSQSSKDSTANRELNPHVGPLNEWHEEKSIAVGIKQEETFRFP